MNLPCTLRAQALCETSEGLPLISLTSRLSRITSWINQLWYIIKLYIFKQNSTPGERELCIVNKIRCILDWFCGEINHACQHVIFVWIHMLAIHTYIWYVSVHVSMAWCGSAVSLLLTHWICCSHALGHRCMCMYCMAVQPICVITHTWRCQTPA